MMAEDIDYSGLNPNIRRTVAFLRSRGFITSDSGDGETHEFECDRPYPYVCIISTDPVGEAQRLYGELVLAGVSVGPINDQGGICIQATYDPGNDVGVVELVNMTDDDL